MHWKPRIWIAVLLGFFFQSLGMLYVLRPKLALIYLLLGAFPLLADKYFVPAGWEEFFTFGYVVSIICAVHVYYVANNYIETKNRPWYSKWYGLVGIPAILFLCVFAVRAFLLEPFRIPSSSMSPTIMHGDHIIISKIGFNNVGTFGIELYKSRPSRTMERGDIIVFEYPHDPKIDYLKRVIGLPCSGQVILATVL